MRALAALAVIAVVASFASAYTFTQFTGANCNGTATTASIPEGVCAAVSTGNPSRVTGHYQATCGTSLVTRTYNASDSSCSSTPFTTTTQAVGVCLPLGSGSVRYLCSASSVAFAAVVIVASVIAMLI
jgi:hypothetical protein